MHVAADSANFSLHDDSSILRLSQESRSPATIPTSYMFSLKPLPADCLTQTEVQRAKNRAAIQKSFMCYLSNYAAKCLCACMCLYDGCSHNRDLLSWRQQQVRASILHNAAQLVFT